MEVNFSFWVLLSSVPGNVLHVLIDQHDEVLFS